MQVKNGNSKLTQERFFVENDKIVINKKTKVDKNNILENGTLATIKGIDKNTNVLTLSIIKDGIDTTVELDPNKHNGFNHSYCQTVHKTQGQTVNNTYVFSTGKTNSNQSYVEFSRHKDNVNLYLVEGTENEFKRNAKTSQVKFNAYENVACKEHYKELNRQEELHKEIAKRSAEMRLEKANNIIVNAKLENTVVKPLKEPEIVYNLTPISKLKKNRGPAVDRSFDEHKQELTPAITQAPKKNVQKLKMSYSYK